VSCNSLIFAGTGELIRLANRKQKNAAEGSLKEVFYTTYFMSHRWGDGLGSRPTTSLIVAQTPDYKQRTYSMQIHAQTVPNIAWLV
jgi:hypothetical protein